MKRATGSAGCKHSQQHGMAAVFAAVCRPRSERYAQHALAKRAKYFAGSLISRPTHNRLSPFVTEGLSGLRRIDTLCKMCLKNGRVQPSANDR
jgi:hypothetical protein